MNKIIRVINSILVNIIGIIASIFYTIKYNWFYILLSILAPIAIYMMGAGREIIALLFDGPELGLNTFILILTLILMSSTIWIIPSLSIYFIVLYGRIFSKTPIGKKTDFFKHLIHLYSSGRNNPLNQSHTQIPAKYLSMIPWTMVCATMIQFNIVNKEMNSSICVFLAINVILFCILVIFEGVLNRKKETIFWAILILMFPIAFFVNHIKLLEYEFNSNSQLPIPFIFLCYAVSMLAIFFLFTKGEKIYTKISSSSGSQLDSFLRANNVIHALLLFINIGSLVFLTSLAIKIKLSSVSSLTVLLLGLNFYMLLVDSLFTSQWVMSEKLKSLASYKLSFGYKIIVGLLFAIFVGLVFFNNTNNYKHDISKSPITSIGNLETYFENWYQKKLSNMSDNTGTMNVYLISGQGGGSRAAVYILSVLRRIESSSGKELYNQTFSISTISGSSAGIGQYIGQHQNLRLNDSLKSVTADNLFSKIRAAYSYNFFNSNLLGLLFYDRIPVCIKDLVLKTENNTYGSFNRNYIQEKEELEQLKNFTSSFINKDTNQYRFFQNNILELYNQDSVRYSTPLVFFNTTILNYGKKGVFSPTVDQNLFCNNIDLMTEEKPVSFHFAEISSQSFPLLNNFSNFNQYYLGDGGIYENSGTSTTLKIYKVLKKYVEMKRYKVRFIIINVLNGIEKKSQEPNCVNGNSDSIKPKSILSLLVNAVSKIPFDGHENDARSSIEQEIILSNRYTNKTVIKDTVINIYPQEQFALSRVFTSKTLQQFIDTSELDKSIRKYTLAKMFFDSLDYIPTKNTERSTLKFYRLYTQYKNKEDKDSVKALLNNPKIKSLVLNIPPIDLVKTSNYNNEIRYFNKKDSLNAVGLRKAIYEINGINYKLKYVPNFSSKVPLGQLELWINSLKK